MSETFLTYEQGYEQGIKDAENTKTGVKRYLMGYEAGKKDFNGLVIEELKKLAAEKNAILALHGFAMFGIPAVILFGQEEIEIILHEVADR